MTQPAAFEPSAFLRASGLVGSRALTVEPLQGGYQNQVFRVRGLALDWVVKRFHPAAEITLFPNEAEFEAGALERLAPHNVAPKPVAFIQDDPQAPVLVYEFYEGRAWHEGLAQVARLLRTIAGVDANGLRLVPMVPRDILAQGERFVAASPPAAQQLLSAARPRPIPMAPGPRSLIHTDFGPGNLIAGEEGLKVIDWQCPAAGDAAEDLAAFLSPAFQILYGRAPLTDSEEAELLAAYDDSETIERLHLLRPFYDWRMLAYCAMRQFNLAATRPEQSERYRLATRALLERLNVPA